MPLGPVLDEMKTFLKSVDKRERDELYRVAVCGE